MEKVGSNESSCCNQEELERFQTYTVLSGTLKAITFYLTLLLIGGFGKGSESCSFTKITLE